MVLYKALQNCNQMIFEIRSSEICGFIKMFAEDCPYKVNFISYTSLYRELWAIDNITYFCIPPTASRHSIFTKEDDEGLYILLNKTVFKQEILSQLEKRWCIYINEI